MRLFFSFIIGITLLSSPVVFANSDYFYGIASTTGFSPVSIEIDFSGVELSTSGQLIGHGWSPQIGYLFFNDIDNGPYSYGVTIDNQGVLAGQAWNPASGFYDFTGFDTSTGGYVWNPLIGFIDAQAVSVVNLAQFSELWLSGEYARQAFESSQNQSSSQGWTSYFTHFADMFADNDDAFGCGDEGRKANLALRAAIIDLQKTCKTLDCTTNQDLQFAQGHMLNVIEDNMVERFGSENARPTDLDDALQKTERFYEASFLCSD